MEQRFLYEGHAGDNILKAIPYCIAKAKELNQDVFLTWNGATMRINKDDTEDKVYQQYHKELHIRSLGMKEERGEVITKDDLVKRLSSLIFAIYNKE